MDDFAVDLDKVLDDFELSEDGNHVAAPGQEKQASGLQEYLKTQDAYEPAVNAQIQILGVTSPHPAFPVTSLPTTNVRYDIPYEPLHKLSLADANFAPSLTQNVQSLSNEIAALHKNELPVSVDQALVSNGHAVGANGSLEQDSGFGTLEKNSVHVRAGAKIDIGDPAASAHINSRLNDAVAKGDIEVGNVSLNCVQGNLHNTVKPEILLSMEDNRNLDIVSNHVDGHCDILMPSFDGVSPPSLTAVSHPDVVPMSVSAGTDVSHDSQSGYEMPVGFEYASQNNEHEELGETKVHVYHEDSLEQPEGKNSPGTDAAQSPIHGLCTAVENSASPIPSDTTFSDGSVVEEIDHADGQSVPNVIKDLPPDNPTPVQQEGPDIAGQPLQYVCSVLPNNTSGYDVATVKANVEDLQDLHVQTNETSPGEMITSVESGNLPVQNDNNVQTKNLTSDIGDSVIKDGQSVPEIVGFDDTENLDLEVNKGELSTFTSNVSKSSEMIPDSLATDKTCSLSYDSISQPLKELSIESSIVSNTVDPTTAENWTDEEKILSSPKHSSTSSVSSLVVEHMEVDRRSSGGSLEIFLLPAPTSPVVSTPVEDPGFSKIPGYVPGMLTPPIEDVEPGAFEFEVALAESGSSDGVFIKEKDDIDVVSDTFLENQPDIDSDWLADNSPCVLHREAQPQLPMGLDTVVSNPVEVAKPEDSVANSEAVSPTGVGARPKELSQIKKNRPNSLKGLSKPDLQLGSPMISDTRDSGFSESYDSSASVVTPGASGVGVLGAMERETCSGENPKDFLNMQLAQKSPHGKHQLNLEIKQQLDSEKLSPVQEVDNRMVDERTVPILTTRMELASGVDLGLPHSCGPAGAGSHLPGPSPLSTPSPSQTIPPGFAQPPGLSQLPGTHEETLQLPPPSVDAAIPGGPQSQTPLDGSQDAQTQPAKKGRPTSLNLPPRPDFQPKPDDSPGSEDISYGGSAGDSCGHTPYEYEEFSEGSGSGGYITAGFSPPEAGPGAFSPPMASSNMNVSITQLGHVAPMWVPDADAPNCMQCGARFTFTKRRHHCRACGKIFCSTCCNLKAKLLYMENKEARVCSKCYQDIFRAQAYERMHTPSPSPNPNNPSEYCSTIPPLQQAQASLNAPPPTVMVPVGVLRKEGSQRNREPKQVMFSDGIRPGGDLTELDGSSEPRLPIKRSNRALKKVERISPSNTPYESSKTSLKVKTRKVSDSRKPQCLIPEHGLPPVILPTGVKGDYSLEENPDSESVLPKIKDSEDPTPVAFAINKNLFVLVKIVNLDCCVNRVCWCLTTKGMRTVGQDEIVVVLECLPEEKQIPRDIFCHFNTVYEEASKGNTVSHLGHTIFGQSFLGSKEHCGFLYMTPTFQCLQKLLLPEPPYIFGILLQRWETPWAKVFPIRLLLRLGAEYRYYPCPVVSVRFRKPVFGEIGHTIMNLLADFRNYQYMLPQIRGVTIHMEEKKTFINFPRNRYDEVMKVINNSNDHVMALGANFSTDADSHLVCIQNEDGNYQTQAINIQNKPRKITGASFVVFNGALKTSSGLRAKSSIVEDGLMVQITADAMVALKQALRDMTDYLIGCGSLDSPNPEEEVCVTWVEDDKNINTGVKSPIDNMAMDGVESIHIHHATDYMGESRMIRWTEVFFIRNDDLGTRCEPVDLSRLAETLGQACCMALTPHLDKLKEANLTKIGLRVNISSENVGYEAGANNEKLPDFYMNSLDNELIPVIHNAASQNQEGPVILELIFHIIE